MKNMLIRETDRVAELGTLKAELSCLEDRMLTADAEGARVLRRQIQQVQRDIRRNTAIWTGQNENHLGQNEMEGRNKNVKPT